MSTPDQSNRPWTPEELETFNAYENFVDKYPDYLKAHKIMNEDGKPLNETQLRLAVSSDVGVTYNDSLGEEYIELFNGFGFADVNLDNPVASPEEKTALDSILTNAANFYGVDVQRLRQSGATLNEVDRKSLTEVENQYWAGITNLVNAEVQSELAELEKIKPLSKNERFTEESIRFYNKLDYYLIYSSDWEYQGGTKDWNENNSEYSRYSSLYNVERSKEQQEAYELLWDGYARWRNEQVDIEPLPKLTSAVDRSFYLQNKLNTDTILAEYQYVSDLFEREAADRAKKSGRQVEAEKLTLAYEMKKMESDFEEYGGIALDPNNEYGLEGTVLNSPDQVRLFKSYKMSGEYLEDIVAMGKSLPQIILDIHPDYQARALGIITEQQDRYGELKKPTDVKTQQVSDVLRYMAIQKSDPKSLFILLELTDNQSGEDISVMPEETRIAREKFLQATSALNISDENTLYLAVQDYLKELNELDTIDSLLAVSARNPELWDEGYFTADVNIGGIETAIETALELQKLEKSRYTMPYLWGATDIKESFLDDGLGNFQGDVPLLGEWDLLYKKGTWLTGLNRLDLKFDVADPITLDIARYGPIPGASGLPVDPQLRYQPLYAALERDGVRAETFDIYQGLDKETQKYLSDLIRLVDYDLTYDDASGSFTDLEERHMDYSRTTLKLQIGKQFTVKDYAYDIVDYFTRPGDSPHLITIKNQRDKTVARILDLRARIDAAEKQGKPEEVQDLKTTLEQTENELDAYEEMVVAAEEDAMGFIEKTIDLTSLGPTLVQQSRSVHGDAYQSALDKINTLEIEVLEDIKRTKLAELKEDVDIGDPDISSEFLSDYDKIQVTSEKEIEALSMDNPIVVEYVKEVIEQQVNDGGYDGGSIFSLSGNSVIEMYVRNTGLYDYNEFKNFLENASNTLRQGEKINLSPMAEASSFAKVIELGVETQEDLLKYELVRTMTRAEVPETLRKFLPGGPDDETIEDIVNSGRWTDVQFQLLKAEANLIAGFSNRQRLSGQFGELMVNYAMTQNINTRTGEVMYNPDASYRIFMTLTAAAEEGISESTILQEDVTGATEFFGLELPTGEIPIVGGISVPDVITNVGDIISMSTYFGGGRASRMKYLELEKKRRSDDIGRADGAYPMMWFFQEPIQKDLHAYIDDQMQGEAIYSPLVLEEITKEFLYLPEMQEKHKFTKENIDYYYNETTYFADAQTMFGKGYALTLMGAMDEISLNLNVTTSAQLDYYLQEQLPEFYTGLRPPDMDYFDRLEVNLKGVSEGYMGNFMYISEGLGFNYKGPVWNMFYETGTTASFVVDFERILTGGLLAIPRIPIKSIRTVIQNTDVIMAAPTKKAALARMTKLAMIGAADEIPGGTFLTGFADDVFTPSTSKTRGIAEPDETNTATHSTKFMRDEDILNDVLDINFPKEKATVDLENSLDAKQARAQELKDANTKSNFEDLYNKTEQDLFDQRERTGKNVDFSREGVLNKMNETNPKIVNDFDELVTLNKDVSEIKSRINDTRYGRIRAAVGGTTVVSALGSALGGMAGLTIFNLFNNKPVRSFLIHYLYKSVGFVTTRGDFVQKALSANAYYRRVGSYERMIGRNKYKTAAEDLKNGNADPFLDILKNTRRIGRGYYEVDYLEDVLNRMGLTLDESVLHMKDLTYKQGSTIAEIAEQLMLNRSDDKLGYGKVRGERLDNSRLTDELLESITGRDVLASNSNGYKQYKLKMNGLVETKNITQEEAALQMAFHRAVAAASKNPAKYYDSLLNIKGKVEDPLMALKNELDEAGKGKIDRVLKESELEGEEKKAVEEFAKDLKDKKEKEYAPEKLYKLIKSRLVASYEHDAYYKSIGLYDYILHKQDSDNFFNTIRTKNLTFEDVEKYIAKQERVEFLDNKTDVQTFDEDLPVGAKPPSKEMEGFSQASLIIEGRSAHVYYKTDKNKLIIGEVHAQSLPDKIDLTKDLLFRRDVTKKLIGKKIVEGIYQFEWNSDQAFHQISDMVDEAEISNAKEAYTEQVNLYLSSFKGNLKQVKSLNTPGELGKSKRSFDKKITSSLQRHKGVLKEESKTMIATEQDLFLETHPELLDADIDLQATVNTEIETLRRVKNNLKETKGYGVEPTKRAFNAVESEEDLKKLINTKYRLLFRDDGKAILKDAKEGVEADLSESDKATKDKLFQELSKDFKTKAGNLKETYQIEKTIERKDKSIETKKGKIEKLEKELDTKTQTKLNKIDIRIENLKEKETNLIKSLKKSPDKSTQVKNVKERIKALEEQKTKLAESKDPTTVKKITKLKEEISALEDEIAKVNEYGELADSLEGSTAYLDEVTLEINKTIGRRIRSTRNYTRRKIAATEAKIQRLIGQAKQRGIELQKIPDELKEIDTEVEKTIIGETEVYQGLSPQVKSMGKVTSNEVILTQGQTVVQTKRTNTRIIDEYGDKIIAPVLLINSISTNGLSQLQKNISKLENEVSPDKAKDLQVEYDKVIDQGNSEFNNPYGNVGIMSPANLSVRKILRDIIMSPDDNFARFIGYQESNILYGSLIRSELKAADVNFTESVIKDEQTGVSYKVIEITEETKSQMRKDNLSKQVSPVVLDYDGYTKQELQSLLDNDLVKEKQKPDVQNEIKEREEEVTDIKIKPGRTPNEFIAQNVDLLLRLMSPEDYAKLVLLFPSKLRKDGRRVLTKEGQQKLADMYDYVRRARSSISSKDFVTTMDKITEELTDFGFSGMKEANSTAKPGVTKVPKTIEMIAREFGVAPAIIATARSIAEPELLKNAIEAAQLLEGPITRGVEGILDTAMRSNKDIKKQVFKSYEVNRSRNVLEENYKDTQGKALAKRRKNASDRQFMNDELIFELRPSQYPSIDDPSKLIPERRRAARDKAMERLDMSLEESKTPEGAQRIKDEIMKDDFNITPNEIDEAFLNLKNEGKNVDRQDLILRSIAYTRQMYAQSLVKTEYVALTSRSIVRKQDVELYSQLAAVSLYKLFGVNNLDELVVRFEGIPKHLEKKVKNITDLRGEAQPFISFKLDNENDRKTVVRLQRLVRQAENTPGMYTLSDGLKDRINNPKSEIVDGTKTVTIRMDDVNQLREAIIDISVPAGSRRNRSIESAHRNAVYQIIKGGLDLFGTQFPSVAKAIQSSVDMVVDLIYERYDPQMVNMGDEQSIRVQEFIKEFHQEMRAFSSEINQLLLLLANKQSKDVIDEARRLLGNDSNLPSTKEMDRITPAMAFVIERLRNFLNPPVDPTHVQFIEHVYRTLNSVEDGFELDLDSPNSRARLKEMKAQLEGLEVDEKGWKGDYDILQAYIEDKNKVVTRNEESIVTEAYDNFKQFYANQHTTVDVLSLGRSPTTKGDGSIDPGEGFLSIKKTIEDSFMGGKGMTLAEQHAFDSISLIEINRKVDEPLTEQQRVDLEKHLSVIYDGVKTRREQIRVSGETILRSLAGSKDFEMKPGLPEKAYTLFYTGRISSLETDLRYKGDDRPMFSIDQPPNGKTWEQDDIIKIARQYGYSVDNPTRADIIDAIKDNFREDLTKLQEPEEIVELANKIINKPQGKSIHSLMDLADNSHILPVDIGTRANRKADYNLIQLEMMIRLMAEEKLSILSRKIAETHVYGDLRKVSREKLIELGFNPITRQEEFLQTVEKQLENYVRNGDIHTRRKHRYYSEPKTEIQAAAQEVTQTIIDTYGIKPATSQKVVRYTAPDGQIYFIPEELDQHIHDTIDRVSPSGVAKGREGTSFKSFIEGNQYRDRIQQQLVVAEDMKKAIADDLAKNKDFPTIKKAEDAYGIVEQYLLETHPDYPETKRLLEVEARANIRGGKETVSVAGIFGGIEESFKAQQIKAIKGARETKLSDLSTWFNDPLVVGKDGMLDPKLAAYLDKTKIAAALHYSKEIEATTDFKAEAALNEQLEDPRRWGRRMVSQYFLGTIQGWANSIHKKFVYKSGRGARGERAWDVAAGVFQVLNPAILPIKFYNTLKKQNVTVGTLIFPNPAYYINNALGAVAQAYISGGITGLSSLGGTMARNPLVFTNTIRYLHKGPFGINRGVPNDGIMVTEDGRLFTAQSLANAAEKYGIGAAFIKAEMAQSIADDIRTNAPGTNLLLLKMFTGKDALSMFYMEMAQTTDNFFRVAHFLDEIHNGNSPSVAAKITRDTYYDYASLTALEREVLREAFLFYAYMRKNQIQVMRALSENPSRVTGQLRLIRNSQRAALEEEGQDIDPMILSEWLHFRYFVSGHAIPWDNTRQEQDYKDRYGLRIQLAPMMGVSDVLPLLSALYPLFSSAAEVGGFDWSPYDDLETGQTYSELGLWLAGQTTPIPKFFFEGVRGKTTFGDQDIDKIRIPKSMVDQLNRVIEYGDTSLFGVIREVDGEIVEGDGFINLKLENKDYQDIGRIENEYYTPANNDDIWKLYILMDLAQTLPASGAFYGRGKKFYGDLVAPAILGSLPEGEILGVKTGEPFELTLGETVGERAASGLSFPSYNLPTEQELRRRQLYERLSVIREQPTPKK